MKNAVLPIVAFVSAFGLALADEPNGLILPPGFHATVVAEGLGPIRHLAIRENGDVYVSTPKDQQNSGGGIIALHLNAQSGDRLTFAFSVPTPATQTVRSQAEADAAAADERLGIARELLALSDRRGSEAEARYREAGGRVEAIAEANAMRRRASTEIVLAEIATARARYTLQDQ